MKAYDIAVFLICFLGALNILSASGFLDSPNCGTGTNEPCFAGHYDIGLFNDIRNRVQGPGVAPQNDETLSNLEIVQSAFGLLIRSIVAILAIFAYITILLPVFLGYIGLPDSLTAMITLGTWISYVIGYAQYKARSTLQGTE